MQFYKQYVIVISGERRGSETPSIKSIYERESVSLTLMELLPRRRQRGVPTYPPGLQPMTYDNFNGRHTLTVENENWQWQEPNNLT
jgi:hypothetical protein